MKRKIILIGIITIVFSVLSFGIYLGIKSEFFYTQPKTVMYYNIPNMRVLLKERTGKNKNINIGITLGIKGKKNLNFLQEKEQVIQDLINNFLCQLREEDFNHIETQLHREIFKRVNVCFPNIVENVYIREVFLN